MSERKSGEEKKKVITIIWFKQHKRHLYKWRSPGGQFRSQINLFVNFFRACPGVDHKSDHSQVGANFQYDAKI